MSFGLPGTPTSDHAILLRKTLPGDGTPQHPSLIASGGTTLGGWVRKTNIS